MNSIFRNCPENDVSPFTKRTKLLEKGVICALIIGGFAMVYGHNNNIQKSTVTNSTPYKGSKAEQIYVVNRPFNGSNALWISDANGNTLEGRLLISSTETADFLVNEGEIGLLDVRYDDDVQGEKLTVCNKINGHRTLWTDVDKNGSIDTEMREIPPYVSSLTRGSQGNFIQTDQSMAKLKREVSQDYRVIRENLDK